jgi:YQGE family putative transporter
MKKFLHSFNNLPLSTKSMVYLMWIYFIGVIISTTFVNIYIFQIEWSYFDVLVFNLIVFTSGAIWFIWMWILFSRLQRNVSQMYYIWYTLFILWFLVLFVFPHNLWASYLFWVFYWFAAGIYWNAVHSQELKNISNDARDFYSSSISAGSNIISVVIPLLISGIFFFGDTIKFDAYTVLFIILPLIYSISFLFIRNIPTYVPKRVELRDIWACFDMKKHRFANLYLFFSGAKHGLAKTSIAIVSILLLENEVNIWIFQWVLAFLSSYVVIHFWLKRHVWNRFIFFLIICSCMIGLYIFLWALFSFYAFILFSVFNLFLFPMYRVSAHTYDLTIMDNSKNWEQDFYPMMLWREAIMLVSRAGSILLILTILYFTNIESELALRIALLMVGLSLLWEVISIYFWEKFER